MRPRRARKEVGCRSRLDEGSDFGVVYRLRAGGEAGEAEDWRAEIDKRRISNGRRIAVVCFGA